MVLVDTSVWIRWFRMGEIDTFDGPNIATCNPVLQEFLQGFKDIPAYADIKARMLALTRLSDPVSADLYLEAADIFRLAHRKGFTIRSSFDCLIAAIAIRHDITVQHVDRDFEVIARFTALRQTKLG
jgi:predicted nucleic acid-binding protein